MEIVKLRLLLVVLEDEILKWINRFFRFNDFFLVFEKVSLLVIKLIFKILFWLLCLIIFVVRLLNNIFSKVGLYLIE